MSHVTCPMSFVLNSQLSAVMRRFIYDTKSIMFDQHLVLAALSNVKNFISLCGQLRKVTNQTLVFHSALALRPGRVMVLMCLSVCLSDPIYFFHDE